MTMEVLGLAVAGDFSDAAEGGRVDGWAITSEVGGVAVGLFRSQRLPTSSPEPGASCRRHRRAGPVVRQGGQMIHFSTTSGVYWAVHSIGKWVNMVTSSLLLLPKVMESPYERFLR